MSFITDPHFWEGVVVGVVVGISAVLVVMRKHGSSELEAAAKEFGDAANAAGSAIKDEIKKVSQK